MSNLTRKIGALVEENTELRTLLQEVLDADRNMSGVVLSQELLYRIEGVSGNGEPMPIRADSRPERNRGPEPEAPTQPDICWTGECNKPGALIKCVLCKQPVSELNYHWCEFPKKGPAHKDCARSRVPQRNPCHCGAHPDASISPQWSCGRPECKPVMPPPGPPAAPDYNGIVLRWYAFEPDCRWCENNPDGQGVCILWCTRQPRGSSPPATHDLYNLHSDIDAATTQAYGQGYRVGRAFGNEEGWAWMKETLRDEYDRGKRDG